MRVPEPTSRDEPALLDAVCADIIACRERDPACDEYSMPLLFFKGFHALQAQRLSHLTMRNIRQNLVFAFGYNTLGVPIAAGVLYPAFGLLLSPMIAAAAMSLSSVSVIANALRLRTARL